MLLASVPAFSPISNEWARQIGERNAAARIAREQADASGMFRCRVSEPGLSRFTHELMPPPTSTWEILIFPSFSDRVVLGVDGQRWTVRTYDHQDRTRTESVLGRPMWSGSSTLPPAETDVFARLFDSALRTASQEAYKPQFLDGTMLHLRDRAGRCAQLHLHSTGTRGDRIVGVLDELASLVLAASQTGNTIDAAKLRRVAREARLLTR
ncbi:hypothetical protein [Silanimonas sp.]|uniref:hypothetical protein n=1 Tax=Silanimonas sp. TaxID=1929290 RepID=UPI0022BC46A1|nr:hypothetical protein [Silanimonas sp.]MCZ8165350.1 hypothetical protein [Silanimonas sp.]